MFCCSCFIYPLSVAGKLGIGIIAKLAWSSLRKEAVAKWQLLQGGTFWVGKIMLDGGI